MIISLPDETRIGQQPPLNRFIFYLSITNSDFICNMQIYPRMMPLSRVDIVITQGGKPSMKGGTFHGINKSFKPLIVDSKHQATKPQMNPLETV